jgi:hypothetical protein
MTTNLFIFPTEPWCDVCGRRFRRMNWETGKFEIYPTCFDCEYWEIIEIMKHIGFE